MLQIEESNPDSPARVCIYGVEGVGKSTFGAKSEKPIFITVEGGIDKLTDANGKRLRKVKSTNTWESVMQAVKDLTNENHDFKTLVIDSADWVEKLCHAAIIGQSGKTITTVNGGYGAGLRESELRHKQLIDLLTTLQDKRKMNIIVTAHYQVKQVKDPSLMEDYDQFEVKCHEMVSSLWREWVDALLFARFRTFTTNPNDTAKARAKSDGSRVVFTRKQPSFQAKNRYGLPEEMDFTENFWNEFIVYARGGAKPVDADELYRECESLLPKVADDLTRDKATKALKDAKGNLIQLQATLVRLKQITEVK